MANIIDARTGNFKLVAAIGTDAQMKYAYKPELMPKTCPKPFPDSRLAEQHVTLGQRYQRGNQVAQSEMMAAAHFVAAVAFGAPALRKQTRFLVESLTCQQTRTAALLAAVFIGKARLPIQESSIRPAGKSYPETDKLPSRRI